MTDQHKKQERVLALAFVVVASVLTACGGGDDDSVTVEGNVSVAYVKRPASTLGNPTDSILFSPGGDLYVRDKSSPSASEQNVTGSMTNGQGDVSDPEVSYDGTRVLFSMRLPGQRWRIYEYDTASKQISAPIVCNSSFNGDDVDPAYLPGNRGIVFSSNRQVGTRARMQSENPGDPRRTYIYVDEYEREEVTALHVMDYNGFNMSGNGGNCRQISFNQSHDRNPTVLRSGEIMFSRWDHVGERNQFTIFKVNPDGSNLFVVYGAHSPGNSYLHPREMPDGRLISTTMPLSGTREGGSLEMIDANNYSDNDAPGTANPPPNQLNEPLGQFQVTRLLFPNESQSTHQRARGMNPAPLGRYSAPYPLWDGTNRVLTVYSPCRVVYNGEIVSCQDDRVKNNLNNYEEADPAYGVYMLDLASSRLLPVVLPQENFHYSDPVALQARELPQTKTDFVPDPTIGTGFGLFDVNTVYDTDRLQRMGDAVLANGESIPRANGAPDIANLKLPGTTQFSNRVARFFRISKSVPTPAGLSREAIGETENEMQQIVGYGVIEPDGSIRARVPADTPVTITALDSNGRGFTEHTHWIQARDGERRFCKGCHSSRLGTTNPNGGSFLNDPSVVGIHPGGTATTTMAQTRAAQDTNYPNLARDPSYTDFWTTQYNPSATPEAPINALGYTAGATPLIKTANGATCNATSWSAKDCSIVINFPDHIQPILTAKCASCHSNQNTGGTPAAGFDLSNTPNGQFGRTIGYQSLLVGPPVIDPNTGLPIITIDPEDGEVEIEREPAAVIPGNSRASRLVERIFEQSLRAGGVTGSTRAFCRAGGASCVNGATYVNHTVATAQLTPLTPAERRLISEWADIGGQYYNDAFDSNGDVRSMASRLSTAVFACRVQPILQANCASCHQPFGGNGSSSGTPNPNFVPNRFILTGNTEADFSVTASMVADGNAPDSSLLLYRPSRSVSDTPPHPGATPALPNPSANYTAISSWITGGASATCP